MQGIAELLRFLTWRDAVDLLALALIVYNLLKLIRGTRAVQLLAGILVLVGIWYLAQLLDLRGLQLLLRGFLLILPFAIIVMFQQPIRRALVTFGKNPLFGRHSLDRAATTFQEIALAADALADRRIGALIVVERAEGLRDYIENGIALDAVVSSDLLINLFHPGTPLHDGAAIIQGDRIAAAACFLPLSSAVELQNSAGTRHRAALGISEETDAVAVVVSEERGVVSLAVGGRLLEDLSARALRNTLYQQLMGDQSRVGASR